MNMHIPLQINTTFTAGNFLDFPSISPIPRTKRRECYVFGTPPTQDPQYLILSTLHVLTTGDTSSTTITELTLHFLMGILNLLTQISVK